MLIAGAHTIFIVSTDGFLIATLRANVQFSGAATIGTDLYVLDGPVLQKYSTTSLGGSDANTPLLAVNVTKTNSRRFDATTQTWAQARAWLYQPDTLATPYAPPLVVPQVGADPVVFTLASVATGAAVRGIDASLTNWAAGAHGAPDRLVWRVQTVAGVPSLCYPSGNQVVSLDPTSPVLAVRTITVPNPRANAVGWVNAMDAADGPQSFVTFPSVDRIVTQAGTAMCDVAASSSQPVLTVFAFGSGGAPQLGQAQITANPPPAALPSAVLTLPATPLASPPWIDATQTPVAAYFVAGDGAGGLAYQKWTFPALADDTTTRALWQAAYTGTNLVPGYMAALCALPPPTPWTPWLACGMAALCASAGTTGQFV